MLWTSRIVEHIVRWSHMWVLGTLLKHLEKSRASTASLDTLWTTFYVILRSSASSDLCRFCAAKCCKQQAEVTFDLTISWESHLPSLYYVTCITRTMALFWFYRFYPILIFSCRRSMSHLWMALDQLAVSVVRLLQLVAPSQSCEKPSSPLDNYIDSWWLLHHIASYFWLLPAEIWSWPWTRCIQQQCTDCTTPSYVVACLKRDSCVCRQHQQRVHILFTGMCITDTADKHAICPLVLKHHGNRCSTRNNCWSIPLRCLIARGHLASCSIVFGTLGTNLLVGLALKRSFAQGIWRFLPIPPLVCLSSPGSGDHSNLKPKWRLMAGDYARALAERTLKMSKHWKL